MSGGNALGGLLFKADNFAADHASGGAPGAQAHQALRRIRRRTWRPETPCHEIRHAKIAISFLGFPSTNEQCILLLNIDMTY